MSDQTVSISGRKTPLDYLFFTRPVLMPPVWTIALLGVAESSIKRSVPLWEWPVFVIQLWCLFGAVYTLNQICDIESDRINRKLFFLPEQIISVPVAWRFTIILNAFAVVLAIPFGYEYIALTAVIIVLGVVYSVGQTPWKNRPLLGFGANVMAHGVIVYVLGAVFAGAEVVSVLLPSVAYGCAVGGVYLATTVADIPGDDSSGKRTIGVWAGGRLTMLIASLLVGTAIVLAIWHSQLALAIAAFISLPFFAWAAQSAPLDRAPLATKVGVAALTLGAAIYFPVYLVFMAGGFFLTRAFFRWRFGLPYPTFG
ncbi:MAG: hypothetical protein GF341_13425 [candidate division Zixibacteria bacterium]|nr:hypothetical protein [candidate division Zixibacteria bacterium]